MNGACSTHGEREGAYRVLLGQPEGKKHWKNLYVDEFSKSSVPDT